jgi:hypothetical protein
MAGKSLEPRRFHPSVVTALEAAGWVPGRSADVRKVLADLVTGGYAPNPFTIGLLEALYGLRIDPVNADGPNFQNTEPFIVDPLGVGRRHREEAAEVRAAVGEDVFPVGWWLCNSHVHVTASGRVVAFSSGLIWHLGHTPEEGLDMAVRASSPLVCIGSRQGQRRWPSGL